MGNVSFEARRMLSSYGCGFPFWSEFSVGVEGKMRPGFLFNWIGCAVFARGCFAGVCLLEFGFPA